MTRLLAAVRNKVICKYRIRTDQTNIIKFTSIFKIVSNIYIYKENICCFNIGQERQEAISKLVNQYTTKQVKLGREFNYILLIVPAVLQAIKIIGKESNNTIEVFTAKIDILVLSISIVRNWQTA